MERCLQEHTAMEVIGGGWIDEEKNGGRKRMEGWK